MALQTLPTVDYSISSCKAIMSGGTIFSAMAAGWFCKKSDYIGKVEDVEPMKKNGFQLATILRRILASPN